jgi:amino acid adenylation domain-containing protein
MSVSTDKTIRGLSKDRSELLKLLRERERKQSTSIQRYPRNESPGGGVQAPLSWAQQRLWFVDQLGLGSSAYHIPLALKLTGSLDRLALRRALDALMQRHEALRTVFANVEGEPRQVIAPAARFSLRWVDLSAATDTERLAQIRSHQIEEISTAFDLHAGPLIRGRLLCLRRDEHLLVVTIHHIIADGWSIGVFIRQLAQLYTAFYNNESNPLPPLPVQYADYAQWQRQWLQGKTLDEQLHYWRERLRDAPPQLDLPTDHPRPALQSYRGENLPFVLEAPLSAKLRAFAVEHQLTLFMLLYAGFAILLSRLSAREDVVIGVPIANRQRPELEDLIGFFVNTLVLRVQVSPDLMLAQLLQQVKEVTLGAYEHQDVPFERVVEALQPQRSLSRNPLFQVAFAMQNAPQHETPWPGLSVTPEDCPEISAAFDLQLTLEDQPDRIVGSFNYSIDILEATTLRRWTASLQTLLSDLVTGGLDRRIGDLTILPESQRREVLELFNATARTYPREMLVHQLFEEQAARTPRAPALMFEDKVVTYEELDHRANQLATYLRARGIAPDQPVALCVERGPDMVVGLLGILKAGGAYVPLDPSYPAERLAYMLEDAAPSVLLTQERFKDGFRPCRATLIALDTQWDEISMPGEAPPGIVMRPHPENLAYIIYTSGSTGKPKGAMNEHRGVVNRLYWMQEAYALEPGDRVLQKTPFSFDVSAWEFFWTLGFGGCLVIARPEGHKDPSYLRGLIESAGVTRLHFVPSMLQSFLEELRPGDCPTLKQIVCSGEELPSALQKRCFEYLPNARLSNLYGPTEAAIDVTAWECSPQDTSDRVPIGRPIANLRVYVLDACNSPVPVGVAGEIFIAGVGVGRGYLNRPELNRERFLRDPFAAEPAARMYRTGDLGRWRPDGSLEYLGRNDHQIKLRGFRIELGEIESQLTRLEEVREAVVLAREDVPGEKRLVAYVTLHNGDPGIVERMREQLKRQLPEHMVPAAFVILPKFPLSPNGKLDRRGLPSPGADAYASRPYEPPQGPVEEVLAGIWQNLRQIERVGRHDNFFALGGHSLQIVRMKESLQRVGLSVEVRTVFETATLAELAATLIPTTAHAYTPPPNLIPPDCRQITPEMLPLVALQQHIARIATTVPGGYPNIQDIYPLTPLQEGLLFHHHLDDRVGTRICCPWPWQSPLVRNWRS